MLSRCVKTNEFNGSTCITCIHLQVSFGANTPKYFKEVTNKSDFTHFKKYNCFLCDACAQVMCASKYLVKGETARDHVDLLLSSRYWPPVYVCDSARQVALCTDLQYPQLAKQMWGRNQGCFSDPFEKPVVCDSSV